MDPIVYSKVQAQFTVANMIKYFIEGLAIAVVAYVIPNRKTRIADFALIAVVAAISLMVLDTFSPDVGASARFGTGAAIGYNLVASAPARLPFTGPWA